MPQRVIIVHGWEGYPEEGWFPWLRHELEVRGIEVVVPTLPDSAHPRIEKWVPTLAKAVGGVTPDTYFVGHSMGCQAVVRYLEGLPEGAKAGGALFVAGFFKRLTGLEDDPQVQAMDRHWLETPVDLGLAARHMAGSVALFSDDDPWVPLDNQDDFAEQLGSRVVIEHGMGHFSGSTGTLELPIALDLLLSIMNI